MITNEQRVLYNQMNQKQVGYFRVHADIMGNLAGGIYLSQLLFWMTDEDGNKKERFLKTDKQIMKHTGLSCKQIKCAKKLLQEKGFARIEKTGSPPRTVYLLDHDKIIEEIISVGRQEKNPMVQKGPLGNPMVQKGPFEWAKRDHSLKDKEIIQEINKESPSIPLSGEGMDKNPNTIPNASESPISHSDISPITNPPSDLENLATPASRKKGTRSRITPVPLPADWEITEEMFAWASNVCPLVNLRIQNEIFMNHFRAEPGEKAEKRPGWIRTWKGWMLREQGRCEERGQTIPLSTEPRECGHKGAIPLEGGETYECDLCHKVISEKEYRHARGDRT